MIHVTRKPAALVRKPSLVNSQAPPYSASSMPWKWHNIEVLFLFQMTTWTAVIQTYTMPAEMPAKRTSPRNPFRGSNPQRRPNIMPKICLSITSRVNAWWNQLPDDPSRWHQETPPCHSTPIVGRTPCWSNCLCLLLPCSEQSMTLEFTVYWQTVQPWFLNSLRACNTFYYRKIGPIPKQSCPVWF